MAFGAVSGGCHCGRCPEARAALRCVAGAAAAAAAAAGGGADFEAGAALLRGAASGVLRDMISRQDAALQEVLAQADHFTRVRQVVVNIMQCSMHDLRTPLQLSTFTSSQSFYMLDDALSQAQLPQIHERILSSIVARMGRTRRGGRWRVDKVALWLWATAIKVIYHLRRCPKQGTIYLDISENNL